MNVHCTCLLTFFFLMSVCLSVSKITQKVMDGFWWNFQEMSEMQWGTTG